MKSVNLAAKFILEVAALASFAYWGGTIGSGAVSVAVAVVAPLLAVTLWGVFAAPNSSRRLSARARIPFELTVFGLAALALWSAVSLLAGIVFALAAIVNAGLLTAFDQWES